MLHIDLRQRTDNSGATRIEFRLKDDNANRYWSTDFSGFVLSTAAQLLHLDFNEMVREQRPYRKHNGVIINPGQIGQWSIKTRDDKPVEISVADFTELWRKLATRNDKVLDATIDVKRLLNDIDNGVYSTE